MITALILILVAGTVAIIALAVAPRLIDRRVVFTDTPDTPKPFGYAMSWLAVKTEDTAAVIACLGLEGGIPANWNCGIGTIYDTHLGDQHIFVAPPVKGWTLIAGVALPHPVGHAFADKLTPLLADLARRFPDVQYYAAFPIIDFFGWSRWHKGKQVRTFIIGDDGVIVDQGRLTPQEKILGLKLYDLRGIKDRKGDAGGAIVLYPTEEQIIRLASAWSCNPLHLDKMNAAPATGLIARVPIAWRAERLKRKAA